MTEAPPETKPEYTTFNAGAGCEGNGAGSIKTLADCSAAGAALGLSDAPAVDDGQDGKSYDPPYCYFEGGSLKFNSAGTNTGDCTDKDACVCLVSAPNACVGLGKDECKASKDACKWMKDKTCIVRPPKDPSPPPPPSPPPSPPPPSPPPETKPEYTTFNAGASCEANGAGPIKTRADCSAAGAALGLSDTPAVDDGQDGKSYDPPYCYFENGSLKFNSAGTNTGDCTDKDTCVCLVSAPNACVGLGKDECKASKDACKWMKDKTCIVRPPK